MSTASAFTIKSISGLSNQLVTIVDIVLPNTNNNFSVKAIWDTGATSTVITQNVVNTLGLLPTGMSHVNTANGATIQSTYIVDVVLPNGVLIKDVTVTGATSLSGGCEVLIGMDIISLGDFSVTNHKNVTCMSFRIPSKHEIDYTTNINLTIKNKRAPGKFGSNITQPKKKRK